MGETADYSRPEVRTIVTQAIIYADLCEAARTRWKTAQQPGSYYCDASAAGLELAAILPAPEREPDSPLLVSIGSPSYRLQRALRGALATDYVYGNRLLFVVRGPHEAAEDQCEGVQCVIADRLHPDDTLYDGDISYETFHALMERGGICKKASPRQRLGRWAMHQLDQWVAAEAELNNMGTDCRDMRHIGGW
jgi:hypothetical protein